MNISDRKILVNQRLKEMGYGSRKLLADHCGVDYRQVGRWISLETTDWPKLENETKLAEFLKIDPQVFHSEKGTELTEAPHGFYSQDIPQILTGVQSANEKLDGIAARLEQAVTVSGPEKELSWITPTVLKLRQQITRLRNIPDMPDLHGLTKICEDLEQRLSSIRTQAPPPT